MLKNKWYKTLHTFLSSSKLYASWLCLIRYNLIVFVTNVKPSTIFGNESYGMLLAAKKGKVLTLVTVDDVNISSGMQVY